MKHGWSLSAITAGVLLLFSGPIYDRTRSPPPDVPAQAGLTVAQGRAAQQRELTRKPRSGDLPVSTFVELTIQTSSGWVIVSIPKDWAGDAFRDLQGESVKVGYDPAAKNLLYELHRGSQQILRYDQVVALRRQTLSSAAEGRKNLPWLGLGVIGIGLLGFVLGRHRASGKA